MKPENFNNQTDNFQNQQSSGRIDFGRNNHFNGFRDLDQLSNQQQSLKPDFNKQQLNNVELPKTIAKEVRLEKYRIFFLSLFCIIAMIVGVFFLLVKYAAKTVQETNGTDTKWLIPTSHILHPACSIIMLVIAAFIFILAMINYSHLLTSVKSYKGDILMNKDSIPYFLTKDYKSLSTRVVYTNWIAIFCYIVGGILIGVFFAIQAATKKSMNTELIVLYVLLPLIFIFHIYTLISVKYRKGRLNAYYGREIINDEEIHNLTKQANKRCLIAFIVVAVIIFFFIAIPLYIVKKKRKTII